VIETGEQLHRGDEPSPTRSAVLVRLSHGHIRIGSFQRLATLGLEDELRRLTAYALRHYFGEDDGEDAPQRLLAHVVRRTARLAASYMAAGFVHGVLNTDNINITGESFDYGPWRFAPSFDAHFTAAYFDQTGLYSFGRQAEAIHWNLVQLAIALRPISDSDALAAAIEPFGDLYVDALVDRFLWRLGAASQGRDADIARVQQIERELTDSGESIDRYFLDHRERRDHPYWSGEPCSMLIDEVEALWAPIAEADDWALLQQKIVAIRAMGEAHRTA
jgi:serine/tyrosine/threonine adenylyltransferase